MAYLLKPLRPAELAPALDLAVARFAETRQLRRTLEERKVIERAKGRLMEQAQPHRGRGVPPPAPGGHEQPPADGRGRPRRARLRVSRRGSAYDLGNTRRASRRVPRIQSFLVGTVQALLFAASERTTTSPRRHCAATATERTVRTQEKGDAMAARTLAGTSSRAASPPAPAWPPGSASPASSPPRARSRSRSASSTRSPARWRSARSRCATSCSWPSRRSTPRAA